MRDRNSKNLAVVHTNLESGDLSEDGLLKGSCRVQYTDMF